MRKPNGEIEIKTQEYRSVFGKAKVMRLPILRGVVSFVEPLVIGTKCLMYSAAFFEEEEEEKDKLDAMTEEEREKSEKAGKTREIADDGYRSNFHAPGGGAVHGTSLCVGQPASEGRGHGDSRNSGGIRGQDCAVFGIYGIDIPDERYPENLYVSWFRA